MRMQLMALAAAIVLAGCGTRDPGSLIGAVAGTKNLHTPEYAVKGATPYDQIWINVTTEALIDGFGQPRPKARPKEFDAPKLKQKAKAAAKAKPTSKWRVPWPHPKAKPPELES